MTWQVVQQIQLRFQIQTISINICLTRRVCWGLIIQFIVYFDFIMSKNTVRSTSSILEYFKWKFTRFMLERKQKKLLKFYQTQKYDKIPSLFKTQKDYQDITLDEFPFLYLMISQNNVDATTKFLQKYPHKDSMFLNDSNPLKCTPTQYAILQNKNEVLTVLQSFGGNCHVSNSEGQNALHLAAVFKRFDAFNLCINKNIDINHVDLSGNTPFHYACRAGSVEMVTALLAARAKKVANLVHQYPIHMAIESGKIQCVTLLDSDISRPYPKYHPIHSAARSNSVQIFKHFYQKNPKFLQQKDQNLSTALHHAVSMQDFEIVKFICDCLPRIPSLILDAQDTYGNTPLHLAFIKSNVQIVRELVQRKSNLEIRNSDEMTPVDYGMTSENLSIKRYLMDLEGWKQHHHRKY